MNKQYFVLGAAIIFIMIISFFNTDILEMSTPSRPPKTVTTMTCEISYFTVEGTDDVIVSYDHPDSNTFESLSIVKVHGIENYSQIISASNTQYPIRPAIKAQAVGYGANYAHMRNVHLKTTDYQNSIGRIE